MKNLIFNIILLIFCLSSVVAQKLSPAQIKNYEDKIANLTKENRSNEAIEILNSLGIHYWTINQYNKAIDYFKIVLDINKERNNLNGIAGAYTQIGNIYQANEDYQNASENFAKALEIRRKQKNRSQIIDALFNYSEALNNINKFPEALKILEEAKTYCLETGDNNMIKTVFGRLAEVSGKSGDSEAQSRYIDAYSKLEEQISKERVSKVEKESNDKIGDIKQKTQAIVSQKDKELKLTSQELEQERITRRQKELELENLAIKEENDRKTLQIRDAELEKQKIQNYSLIAGLILLSLLLLTIFRGYLQKKRTNEQLSLLNKEILKQKDEITNQNHRLESQNHELVALNNEKNYIIGIVAHDLKSPLNNFRGLLELLRLKPGAMSPEQLGYVELMVKAVDRSKAMISRILDVNAIESKDLKVNLKETDLGEVIKNVLEDKVENVHTKKINILTNFKDKKVVAKVDDELFYQVMENLVSNAIKFSPFNKNIFINLTDTEDSIRTEITDEGPGLTEDDKQKLFKKFQKLSARPTNGESSTGLGLSIVKKYVNAMDGDIRCESTFGKGTSFIIEFKKSTVSQN